MQPSLTQALGDQRTFRLKAFPWQALGFHKFSLLGWSDGGITALIAAAKNPGLINKMVVWGSNAYVSQQDISIYNGTRARAPPLLIL